jgi:hypothetical protein
LLFVLLTDGVPLLPEALPADIPSVVHHLQGTSQNSPIGDA